jgi:predicted esterase
MRIGLLFLTLWSVWLQVKAVASPPDDSTNAARVDQRDLQFTQVAPYSDGTDITRHFGYRVDMPEYNLTNESFRLLVPRAYSTNGSWGLLVWISASDEPIIPADWERELEGRGLLLVSARHSGNQRHPLDRFRLALDATCNICRSYKVDRRRIYVAGFSGGARIASMLGVAYADVFTGTVCICGVNFYKDVIVGKDQYYPATFVPDPGVLLLGKRSGRFVLFTGEHDENLENTRSAFREFKREGFRQVVCFEVPGMSHAMPTGKMFGKALDYLATGKE